jgi:hypothetical protein
MSSTGNATIATADSTANTFGSGAYANNAIGGGANSANTIGAGANSNNTIGAVGTSTNVVTGAVNTITGSTSSTVSGANASLVLSNNNAVMGVTGGSKVTATNTVASMVTATSGGLVITDAPAASTTGKAVLTGGTATAGTNMTLDNTGATFAQNGSGSPVRVTGIADGTLPFDAVNVRQLKALETLLSYGIASSAAMANLPALDQTKEFSMGMALGNFNSQSAFAIGGQYRIAPNAIAKASFSSGVASPQMAFGIGVGWSW